MAKFRYIGEDQNGKKVEHTVDATDRYAVYEVARKEGHTVISVNEGSSFNVTKLFNLEAINYFLSKVKDDELVMMTRNLGSMLVAGLPLSRCLSVIERQTKNPRMKGVMQKIQARITKGDQFNEALAEFPEVFDDLYVSMVRAGEESGGMADALRTLSIQMERSSSLKKKIKGAMMYPTIIIIIMGIIGVLMMIYVMPSITGTFKSLNVDLPPTTQFLMAMSDFLVAHTLIALGSIAASIIGFLYALRTPFGKRVASWVIVRLPVIGDIAREANAARTARTLASLLASGVDVLHTLEITEDVVQNFYYKRIIAEARVQVEKGSPLSETFIKYNKLYPVLVGEMISVGEETGQISEMLQELAVFYENEVEHKTKDLSTIIEPLLMVFIGGSVGFFALAMIAPIYSIGDSI